jgi:NTE family protein
MARIGLVLGAGGVLGHAFHVGVMRALEEATGWDPRDAEIIVGTSAGSHVAAYLRAGASTETLTGRIAGERVADEDGHLRHRLGDPFPVPPPRPRVGLAAPRMALRSVARPWSMRPAAAMSAWLPAGQVSMRPFAARINLLFPEGRWPSRDLWLPVVDLERGHRHVLGRGDAPDVDVGTAVAASCAVPAWFRPVRIDGVRYIDGGVHSATNLDLLAGHGLDLVIVSSPMSIVRSARPRVDLGARWSLRMVLGREARAVRRSGTDVVAFQPTALDVATMGWNGMDPRHRREVVVQAQRSAAERLADERFLERLAPLRDSDTNR